MKVRIVLAPQNAAWVIGKMADRLRESLCALGVSVDLAEQPDPCANVNHWMSFAFAEGCPETLNTMFITHIDDPYKIRLVRDLLRERIQLAICMSRHSVAELIQMGVPSERLHYVLPAIDEPAAPKRIRIGITTKLYDDGRKRESLLLRLSKDMELSCFHFAIFGSGWERIIEALVVSGATVAYDPGTVDWKGDYARIRAALHSFDYYLYLGMDEGSLGALDAVSAGVRTILSAQGFHLEIPGGIDHPFVDYEELKSIFEGLATEQKRMSMRLVNWTWPRYAMEHLEIWKAMRDAAPGTPSKGVLDAIGSDRAVLVEVPRGTTYSSPGWFRFYLRMMSVARIRGAVARSPWMRPIRRFLRR